MSLPSHDRYFLTRQTANIMEDLSRRLQRGGTVSVIIGARGIGKSRLLQQFQSLQAGPEAGIIVQFLSHGSFVVFPDTEQSFPQADLIKRLTDPQQPYTTLILDQFENLQPDIQRQIIRLPQNNAVTAGVNLVIAIPQKTLKQFTSLISGLDLQVDTVELKPLSYQQRLEYVQQHCCAGLRQQAVVPSMLKKMLENSANFTQLNQFLEQHGDEISCAEQPLRTSSWLPRLFGYVVILALLIGLSISVINDPVKLSKPPEGPGILQQGNPPFMAEKKQPAAIDVTQTPIGPTGQQAPAVAEVVKQADEKNQVSSNDQLTEYPSEQLPRPSASVKERIKSSSSKTAAGLASDETLLQQRVQATRDWLDSSDQDSSSIQIMTVVRDEVSDKSLERYLKRLKSKGIDLNEIKVYQVTKSNRQMYSVLYGNFDTMKGAYQQMETLPAALDANQPIARTVKGIMNEIRSQ